MELTFLGTGTSQGVPVITCDCKVCSSKDPRDNRLRSSVLIRNNQTAFTIDAGPDFRYQMLRENVLKLDGIFVTHGHKDHVGGMDDIRAFNFRQRKPMTVFADSQAIDSIKKEFFYAFEDDKYPGVPNIDLRKIDQNAIHWNGLRIIPIPVMHGKLRVTAYRIGELSYITDTNYISKESMRLIEGSKYLVINSLRKEKHISHFNLEEALQVIAQLKPQKAFLTHISHLLGTHEEISDELPSNVELAYDGLKISFDAENA
jgi:phosphoribosyl 1,2-cyclic phosphate phosphodiesterase